MPFIGERPDPGGRFQGMVHQGAIADGNVSPDDISQFPLEIPHYQAALDLLDCWTR